MSERYEPHERHQFTNGGDFHQRLVAVERLATALDTRDSIRERDMERLAAALESATKEIHEFRELVAAGKGAWWGAGLVIGALMALAGGIGAAVHKLWP